MEEVHNAFRHQAGCTVRYTPCGNLSIFMPLPLHGKRGNWVSPVSVGVHFCVHIGNSLSGQKDLEKTWHSRMYITWKTKVCSLKD